MKKKIELKNNKIVVKCCSRCPFYYIAETTRKEIECPAHLATIDIPENCPLEDGE